MPNIFSVVLADVSFGHCVVTAHNSEALGDDEWMTQYIDHVARLYAGRVDPKVSNLVFAEGLGPTPKQRKMGNDAVAEGKPYKLNVAVVTDSFLVRGAVAAISWFNPLIKAFGPEQATAAAARLGILPACYPQLQKALVKIRTEVGEVQVLNRALALFGQGSSPSPTVRSPY